MGSSVTARSLATVSGGSRLGCARSRRAERVRWQLFPFACARSPCRGRCVRREAHQFEFGGKKRANVAILAREMDDVSSWLGVQHRPDDEIEHLTCTAQPCGVVASFSLRGPRMGTVRANATVFFSTQV